MPNDLLLGIAISVCGYLMLAATGVNGVRHARILGLGIDGYVMASIWLWIALIGSLNLISSIRLITAYGTPTGLLFDSGHLEPFRFGLRNWVVLAVGFVICAGLCFRSFIMVRNAKRMTKEMRSEHARTYSASLSLKAALKKDA